MPAEVAHPIGVMCYSLPPMLPRMKRSVGVGTFVAVCAALVGWLSLHERDTTVYPRKLPDAGADGAPGSGHSGAGVGGQAAFDLDAGFGEIRLDALDAGALGDAGMADLGDAPKAVRFGAVLVQYAGAQGSKRDARSRAEALELAGQLAELAKTDFAAAVKKGDPGSVEDAGRMFRGILEPRPEVVLFSLAEDEVSEPVDTPRGYWIVKRID